MRGQLELKPPVWEDLADGYARACTPFGMLEVRQWSGGNWTWGFASEFSKQNPCELKDEGKELCWEELKSRVSAMFHIVETEPTARIDAIVANLPRTGDGVPFFIGDTLYIQNTDRGFFGPEPVLAGTVHSISQGVSFAEYRGDFTIETTAACEAGNLDFYSTREAVPNEFV